MYRALRQCDAPSCTGVVELAEEVTGGKKIARQYLPPGDSRWSLVSAHRNGSASVFEKQGGMAPVLSGVVR